jgi:streptomycin 6-kinase
MNDLLEYYSNLWSLSNIESIAKTYTGHIYKVDSKHGPAVLKIFTEAGIKDEHGGTYFLQACSGKGAAYLFEYSDNAQLIEYLPGQNLYECSKNEREEEATLIFIKIIKKIHKTHIIENREKLTTLNQLFRLFDKLNPPQGLNHLFQKANKLSKYLLATQTQEVLLHGDLHHENILKNANGECVCFDPKGMIGDPAYELGTTLKNPWAYPDISQNIEMFKKRADTFSTELNLPLDRIIGFCFIHLCLSIAWAIEDGGDYSHQEILALKVEKLVGDM